MEFLVLGPLEISDGLRRIEVRAAKQRELLALLLCHANSPLSPQHIEAALWGAASPKTAAENIRSYVYQLRRVLGHERIVRRPAGYAMVVAPEELDSARFEALVRRGLTALSGEDPHLARELLHEALDLWRGRPFGELDHVGPLAEEADRLTAVRELAHESRIEADLRLGRHREVTDELRQLVARDPLRERLCAQLMIALSRSGRTAEALSVYRSTRALLVEELGIDPGAELQRLEQAILRGDAAVGVPAPERTTPRQLPARTPHFVGRTEHLLQLDAPNAVRVITGMAGIGKSALALHWAYRNAPLFPDGQLYVNLRGFDPAGTPIPPGEAVRGFLDALAVPVERIPASIDAQTALYRSLLTDLSVLVVLDNAYDVDQVRPLLPGSPSCSVLVTSRNQLAGLVAHEGARLVALDPLPDDESTALLLRHLGPARIHAERRSAADLVDLCARLPLALTIAAARATISPGLSLSALCDELRSRLDAFDLGDPMTSLRAVFSMSYLRLGPQAARVFRLLGLHPGPDVALPAVASLAGVTLTGARDAMRELVRSNLVVENADRFGLHDLLRAYAIEQGDAEPAALRRMLDHYVHTAFAASLVLEPTRDPIDLPAPSPGTTPERLRTGAEAWYEAEHRVCMAVLALAESAGFHEHAWQLPWTFAEWLNRTAHWRDLLATQHTALMAATRLGDPHAMALAHRELGKAHIRLGEHAKAEVHLKQALALFGGIGARSGEALTHLTWGWLLEQQDQLSASLVHAQEALRLYRLAGNLAGQANALNAVAWCHAGLGEYELGLAHCLQALEMHHNLDDRLGEAATWDSFGYINSLCGHHAEAVSSFARAVSLYRGVGDRYFVATALTHLGDEHLAAGERDEARAKWTEALAVLDELQHPDAQTLRRKLSDPGAPGLRR